MTSAGRGRNFTTALAMMITMDMSHFFFLLFLGTNQVFRGVFCDLGVRREDERQFFFLFFFSLSAARLPSPTTPKSFRHSLLP